MPQLLARSFGALALGGGRALGTFSVVTEPTAAVAATKPHGSFLSAELPGEVKSVRAVRDTLVGEIEHHTASATVGGTELSITATELPGFVTAVTSDNMLYRKARRELLRNYDGTSSAWSSCSHAGYACRLLRYVGDDGRKGVARFYLHDGVLVVVNAVYVDDDAIAKRFLASVK